jgi:hypothetical protein
MNDEQIKHMVDRFLAMNLLDGTQAEAMVRYLVEGLPKSQEPTGVMKTLEQYLKDDADRGVIDHTVRCVVKEGGRVTFYIHPDGVDGETPTFEVSGNTLAQDRDVLYPGDPGYPST